MHRVKKISNINYLEVIHNPEKTILKILKKNINEPIHLTLYPSGEIRTSSLDNRDIEKRSLKGINQNHL